MRWIILYATFFLIVFLLPGFHLVRGWYNNNFAEKYIDSGLEYTDGISGLENLPKLDFDNEPPLCYEILYLGPDDIPTDCSSRCGSAEYEYIFVDKDHTFVVNKIRLQGAYCILKERAKCNLNLSVALIGDDGYKCISKFPQVLGGESGNMILACDGKLEDRLLRKTYVSVVPSNLNISNFDEILEDGSYRFACPDNHNLRFSPTIIQRLETITNVCSIIDKKATMNIQLECQCTVGQGIGGTCTLCPSGFGKSYDAHGAKYGYTIALDCVDPTRATLEESKHVKWACGEKTLQEQKTCTFAVVNGTNTYSPMALENIYK